MKVIVAFKTHFDIGYTDLASKVVEKYSNKMLDDVIQACEQTQKFGKDKQYVWTMSSWPLKEILKNAPKDKKIKAEKLIKLGQLVPHGLPFTTHTELLTQDELSYGCLIAKRICEKYSIPSPVSAKMTDVPGHTAGIVDVLAKNNIKFLHLGCNPASKYPKVPMLFWWESKNGNRVLTMYNTVYGSELMPPADWKFPVWLAMQQTYDNVGPQSSDIIENIESELDGKADFKVGTMDDFYNEISKCDLSDLPVIKGELGDSWIHGVGTYPPEVSKLRRARQILKELNVNLNDSEDLELIDTYYENILLFGEHTYGLDVLTYIRGGRRYDKQGFLAQQKEGVYDFMQQSWDEKKAVAYRAVDAVNKLAKKYNYAEKPKQVGSSATFSASVDNGKLVIVMPNGKRVTPTYEYSLISFWKMSEFIRHYLQRMCHWGLSHFGRDDHPENLESEYVAKISSWENKNGSLIVNYECDSESFVEYGNAKKYQVVVTCLEDRVLVKLNLFEKQASPRLEALNMYFDIETSGNSYLVTKCGQEIDPTVDIVDGSNQVLFASESYSAIDDVAINTKDAPLCAFGVNPIFERTLIPFEKPNRKCIVYNLFNNQWGTNFPLYSSGSMSFEWEIMDIKTAKKNIKLSKCDDELLKK